MSLGYFWGGQQARALYVERVPRAFLDRVAERAIEREKHGVRERERGREAVRRKDQNRMWPGLVEGGGAGRGQKPSARICYAPWILDASHKREPFIGNQEPTYLSGGSRKS